MRYEKPRIMDLNKTARSVDGQANPNVCFPGSVANGNSGACSPGSVVNEGEDCVAGGVAQFHHDPGSQCFPGGTPPGGTDCISGGSPYACNSGSAPATQDFGCTVGPSFH